MVVIVAAIGLVTFSLTSVFKSSDTPLTDRERFELLISKRSDSIDQINKKLDIDNYNLTRKAKGLGKMGQAPNLRMEDEFIMFMDPALGYVPHERRVRAMEITERMMRERDKLPSFQALNLQWTERGPSTTGGRTRAILFDPNDPTNRKVWAGGVSGGLWFTNDITAANPIWNKMSDLWENLAITGLAADPTNPQIMYAATGEGWFNADAVRGAGVWKTTNGGTSWSRLASTNNVNWFRIQKIMVAPNGHVYIATRVDGLIRSTDKGATWSRVFGSGLSNASPNDRIADIEIAQDGTIYIGVGIDPFNSTDGVGVFKSPSGNLNSFTKVNTGANGFPAGNFGRVEIALSKSSPDVLYAITESANEAGAVYRTANGGQTWTQVSLPLLQAPTNAVGQNFANQAWYALILEVHPTNPNIVVAGGLDLVRTLDGGQNWSQISQWFGSGRPFVHADHHAIVFRPGVSETALFGHDGGISISNNITQSSPTFETINQNYNITQYYAGAIHPGSGVNYFLGGTQDNGSLRIQSQNFGTAEEVFGGDGAFAHIDQLNPLMQFVSAQNNFMIYSRNSFTTTPLQSDVLIRSQTGDGSFINVTIYDSREKTMYADVSRGTNIPNNFRFWRSRNISLNTVGTLRTQQNPNGQDSARFVIGSTSGARAASMALSPHAPTGTSRLYIGTRSGRVIVVADAKADNPNAVSEITGNLPPGNISSLEVGSNDNEILATYSNFGVAKIHKTTNGGTLWVDKTGNFPDNPVHWAWSLPSDRRVVLIGTETGVWGTENIDALSPVWVPLNNGLANVRVSQLKWRSSDNTLLAATHGRGMFTANTSNLVTSVRTKLADNAIAVFPNPATDFININANNLKLTKVVITNLLGQTVYQSEIKNQSELKIATSEFNSGIYLVNLTTESGVLTKRIRIN